MAWDEGLSTEQRIAARRTGCHSRLLAGPGTGKTRTLTGRIIYLVQELKVKPSDILAITFTRAAASELRSRVAVLLGGVAPQIVTLHSFALSTILERGAGGRLPAPIRIADDYEERFIIQEDLKAILKLDKIRKVRDLVARLSADWETLAADQSAWESRFPHPNFLGVWREHRKIYGYTLRAELVYQLKRALEEGEFQLEQCPKHVLVDEYQDLNACDLAVVRSLSEAGAQLYVAGDDDQSIYGFRYANPDGIRRFISEYEGSADLKLSECRRCAGNILDFAMYVARQDVRREDKPLTANKETDPGEVHLLRFADTEDEAKGIALIARHLIDERNIAPDRILVLLRSDADHKFSEPIRKALEIENVPSATVENPFAILDYSVGREFLSVLRLLYNRQDSLAWRTMITERRNHLGDQSISRVYDLARIKGVTFAEALGLVQANAELVEGQGDQIKAEYESLNATLDTMAKAIENAADFASFVDWMFDTIFREEKWAEVNQLVHHVLAENELDSVKSLLSLLSTPPSEAGQVVVGGSVNIMTMHQAKGLEADAVFVAVSEDEYIPGRAEGEAIDDERRLLYVSLTRARSLLYVTYCTRRSGTQKYSGTTSGSPARHLTQFLSGGPILPIDGGKHVSELGS